MTPTTYSGTHLVNGLASGTSACVTGFDQVSFIMGSSASIFNVYKSWCLPVQLLTILLLQTVDGPNGNFTGLDSQNNDVAGIQYLYDQLSSIVQSRSFDVANWPNVSGSCTMNQTPMSDDSTAISGRQPCHVPGLVFAVALTCRWWFQPGASTSRVLVHESKNTRCNCRCGRKCRRLQSMAKVSHCRCVVRVTPRIKCMTVAQPF